MHEINVPNQITRRIIDRGGIGSDTQLEENGENAEKDDQTPFVPGEIYPLVQCSLN